ncbi:potassium channel family protein [Gellertiella hungarica]|uniref:Voltage-gated potassium channel n=1 Tax=Gellertiella hungarica TaxID=1572859 RepID=A0A7W6J3B6_9HYPH|nr:potassium channel family protein [Gellertiella hungarica]MBB4063332.1 voltage-gated potassium channel [Gellertiella hungarica]
MHRNGHHHRSRFVRHLRSLYQGQHRAALRFQAFMAVVDIGIIAFFLAQPYLRDKASFLLLDYAFALWIMGDLLAQYLVARDRRRFLLSPMIYVDIAILATLLLPHMLVSFAFLRAMRIWAIARRPILKAALRHFHLSMWTDVVRATINMVVFLFTASGFVYTFFFQQRESGNGFVDALYFTVTTMTTTGFGDITLPGTAGKLTSIIMMIVGISLFVRLAQALVRPFKVTYPCPKCGLSRHDTDAVHCKACGHLLNIPDEGI